MSLSFVANKEQYKIAQNFCLNSHNQLMKKKFLLWRHHYENSKIAKYFKEKRSMQRLGSIKLFVNFFFVSLISDFYLSSDFSSFLAWYAYFSKKKSQSNSFREFQRSHKRTNFGLMKCFKIWQTKWILSRKADNQVKSFYVFVSIKSKFTEVRGLCLTNYGMSGILVTTDFTFKILETLAAQLR